MIRYWEEEEEPEAGSTGTLKAWVPTWEVTSTDGL